MTINEQVIFQTISQLAIQFKINNNLTDADAVSRSSSFVQKIVSAAKSLASNGENELMFYQTLAQLSMQYLFRDGKTDDEAVNLAKSFVESMKVEATTIVNS